MYQNEFFQGWTLGITLLPKLQELPGGSIVCSNISRDANYYGIYQPVF